MTVKNYVLDINKTSLQHPSIVLRQDDYNIYTVNISVTENGVPVNLGSYTLNFLGITPAGAKIIDSENFITTAGDLAVGKFSYRFPKEAAGSKGVYDVAYFRLKTTSGATSTIDLNLRVLGGIDLTADEVKDYITVDDTLRNTLVSEVFKKVDAKVDDHLATVKKGDKGDTGPQGAPGANGKDGVVDYSKTVNITGDQTVAGTKTFSSSIIGSVTGNAGTSTKLATARTIGGVSFDGTQNINLPGVNTAGNQNTSGKAATAGRADTATKADSATTANDPNALHQSGNESASGTKTFTGTLVANNPIKGNTIRYNILDGYDLNGYKDTGDFVINGANNLVNYPNNAYNYAVLHVEKFSNETSIQTLTTTDNVIYTRVYGGNPSSFGSWVSVADDKNVVHNTGNETVAGDKTFTGQVAVSGTLDAAQKIYTRTITIGTTNDLQINYTRVGNVVIGRCTVAKAGVFTLSNNDGYKVPTAYPVNIIGYNINAWFENDNKIKALVAGVGNFVFITNDPLPQN